MINFSPAKIINSHLKFFKELFSLWLLLLAKSMEMELSLFD